MIHWSATTVGGALWFLCVCVTLTVNIDATLSRTWCYTSDSEDIVPQTLSCNHGNVLWVAAAVPGIHTANRRGFCRAPSPSGSDCPLEAAAHTDQYRHVCHGRVSCTFLLTRRPPNTCPGPQQGPMYLHMEYSCVQAADADGHAYPTVHPVASEQGEAGSGQLWLVSTGYPMEYEDMAETQCSLLTDPGTRLEVSILDLSVVVDLVQGTQEDQQCLYSLRVGNHSTVCAQPGARGTTVTIHTPTAGGGGERTETLIQISVPQPHTEPVQGRFWVTVTGYQGDSAILAPFSVSCTNPLSPYQAPSTGDEAPSVAHIVVPVILVLLIIIIIIVIIIVILLWRRRKRKAKDEESPAAEEPHESSALNADSQDADGEDENLNKRRGTCCFCCHSMRRKKKAKDEENPAADDNNELSALTADSDVDGAAAEDENKRRGKCCFCFDSMRRKKKTKDEENAVADENHELGTENNDSKDADSDGDGEAGKDENRNKRCGRSCFCFDSMRQKRKAKEEETPSPEEKHEPGTHSGKVTGLWGEALNADSKDTDSKDAGSKDADSKDAGSKDVDSKDVDSKDVGSKDTDSKDVGSKDTDSKDVGSKDTDSKDVGSKDTDSKDVGSKDTDSKDVGSKDVDSKDVDKKDADSNKDGEAGEDENLNKRRGSRTDEDGNDKPENKHKSTTV